MKKTELETIRSWFESYVPQFYGDDDYTNANIKLKDIHSRKVADEMLWLAQHLNFTEEQKNLAEAIGLLHDIGRFEQFIKYKSYNDPKTGIQHSLLGVEILHREHVVDTIEATEREILLESIRWHGAKQLSDELKGDTLLFAQLIRDADKIDIFRIVTEYYEEYENDPENFKLEVELPDEPRYTPEVCNAILAGERINYAKLQTWNDMRICQMGWVYDINFPQSLQRIRERGLLEKLTRYLPDDDNMQKLTKMILNYTDRTIEQYKRKVKEN